MRLPRLDGTRLKQVACVAMVADHAAVTLLPYASPVYVLLRAVGRLAFPVFVLLVVEGATYTRDWRRYLLRLLFLAVVSEPAFDLMLRGTVFAPSVQDVFWELALVLLTSRLAMLVDGRLGPMPGCVAAMTCGVVLGAVAEALGFDYGFLGVLLGAALWCLRGMRTGQAVVTSVVLVAELPGVLLGSLAVACYDGTRGDVRRPWLFYWFYPGHIAALVALRALLSFMGVM